MSRRSAARGSEAARSIRLALRTSSIVAVSSARPSRWLLCCRGSRRPMSSPIAAATVTIPPTTSVDLVPAGRADPYRWPTVAAQEVMGGKACHPSVQPRGPQRRWGEEPLQAGLEAADAAPEQGGQAAAEVAGLSIRDFFRRAWRHGPCPTYRWRPPRTAPAP